MMKKYLVIEKPEFLKERQNYFQAKFKMQLYLRTSYDRNRVLFD